MSMFRGLNNPPTGLPQPRRIRLAPRCGLRRFGRKQATSRVELPTARTAYDSAKAKCADSLEPRLKQPSGFQRGKYRQLGRLLRLQRHAMVQHLCKSFVRPDSKVTDSRATFGNSLEFFARLGTAHETLETFAFAHFGLTSLGDCSGASTHNLSITRRVTDVAKRRSRVFPLGACTTATPGRTARSIDTQPRGAVPPLGSAPNAQRASHTVDTYSCRRKPAELLRPRTLASVPLGDCTTGEAA